MTAIRLPAQPVAALLVGAWIGLAAGVATACLQGVFSSDWNTVANSGAVWTAVAFAATLALTRTPAVAAAVGLLALIGEVVGYYVYAVEVLHMPVMRSAVVLWTVAALWIGPLTGFTAFHARWSRGWRQMAALCALAGVIAGEGAYLIRVAGVPRSGWVEVAVAGVLVVAAVAVGRAPARGRLVALSAGMVAAAAVYAAYRLLAIG